MQSKPNNQPPLPRLRQGLRRWAGRQIDADYWFMTKFTVGFIAFWLLVFYGIYRWGQLAGRV